MTMHSLNKGNRGWVPLLEVIVLVLKEVASWNRATVPLCLSKDVVVRRGDGLVVVMVMRNGMGNSSGDGSGNKNECNGEFDVNHVNVRMSLAIDAKRVMRPAQEGETIRKSKSLHTRNTGSVDLILSPT